MDEDILLSLGDIVVRHPWWRARAALVLALLERLGIPRSANILEAGCGWGTNLDVLERAGYPITGLDISRKMLCRLDRPHRRLIEADLSRPLPDDPPTFDCVLALDVIEHIDDDRRAVAQLARLLKPGGKAIFSVPALPELYSEFDEIQGHRRRYTAQSLRACLVDAGLVVEDLMWWGQWMVRLLGTRKARPRGRPGDAVADIYRRYLSLPPWPGPWAMRAIFAFDQRRTLRRQNVTGTSLIAVAARPSPSG